VRSIFPAVIAALILSIPFDGLAQETNLQSILQLQMSKTDAKFGVAWKHLANGDTGTVNG
jgi:hypothetical protein